MKKIIQFISILLTISPLIANNPPEENIIKKKHIILAQGDDWTPLLAENLIKNHSSIEKLPFSGFIMLGNSFTDDTMRKNEILTHKWVWKEVHGLKNLYKEKTENFLRVNIQFPGDFWDDTIWTKVRKNFGMVARVAKELGFKGIALDDEGYGSLNKRMINFKFPSKSEVKASPNDYTYWEKAGSDYDWVDKYSYRNPDYTFKEHMDKVTSRFKEIMIEMQKEENYPNLTMLVYFGPSIAHTNVNKENLIITDLGKPKQQEYKGAMFLGLKEGIKNNTALHDMGENYKYRKDKHFENSYLLRKHKIASNLYNDDLNAKYQWKIPKKDRLSWASKVNIGFMVFNKGEKSHYLEYDTRENSTAQNIQYALKKALKYSDKYVIYYCQDQDWLRPKKDLSFPKEWYKMMQELYEQK